MPDLPEFPPEKAPHRIIDDFFDAILSGAVDLGEDAARKLDQLPGGDDAPHRSIDGILDALLESTIRYGEGIADALDQPPELAEKREYGGPP